MKRIQLLPALIFVAGCAGAPEKVREQDRQTVKQELSEEMSLKADRESLEDLRKEIPEETRRKNDELALYLQLMKQGTEQPQVVRAKFQILVQKRRTSFRDKVTRLRDTYHREETKRREEFLSDQKAKRESFQARKHDSKANREFFSDQDRDRRSFFADERDRRQNFESEVRAQSKDFESYMREKTNEFNEQYRLYSKKFSERPKEKKAVTGETGGDFKRLNEAPTEPLGTDH
jgi:hypothetical protein